MGVERWLSGVPRSGVRPVPAGDVPLAVTAAGASAPGVPDASTSHATANMNSPAAATNASFDIRSNNLRPPYGHHVQTNHLTLVRPFSPVPMGEMLCLGLQVVTTSAASRHWHSSPVPRQP